jgi:glycosyltransferase involved in cell wall biosynthesis
MNKEITFIRHYPTTFESKLARVFKKQGYTVNLISFFNVQPSYREYFDKNMYLVSLKQKNISPLKKILKVPRLFFHLIKVKNSVVIGVSQPNWFVTLVFILLRPLVKTKIYFPYDITCFRFKKQRYQKLSILERLSELFNFRHCDGIIHKGPEEELTWLPKRFKATDPPSIQFLPYCVKDIFIKMNKEFLEKKTNQQQREPTLVYVGRVVHDNPGRFSDVDIFQSLSSQQLHVHIYALNYDRLISSPQVQTLTKNPFFHLHPPIHGNELNKEISQYDWGINLFRTNFKEMRREWARSAFGNKAANYLEAGLPIIVNEEMAFTAFIIKEYDIGITVKDIEDTARIIKNTNYEEMLSRVQKNRQKFTFEANIDRLLEFINDLECINKVVDKYL